MKIFVERPIATAMFFLAVLVLGIYSFLNIPFELAPKEEFPQITINTSWPDVPPEVIQTQITSPLEEISSTAERLSALAEELKISLSQYIYSFESPHTNANPKSNSREYINVIS